MYNHNSGLISENTQTCQTQQSESPEVQVYRCIYTQKNTCIHNCWLFEDFLRLRFNFFPEHTIWNTVNLLTSISKWNYSQVPLLIHKGGLRSETSVL